VAEGVAPAAGSVCVGVGSGWLGGIRLGTGVPAGTAVAVGCALGAAVGDAVGAAVGDATGEGVARPGPGDGAATGLVLVAPTGLTTC
jgi:hypothetical protein